MSLQGSKSFSDPTDMPHLRSVLTGVTTNLFCFCGYASSPLLEVLRSFEKVLTDRGVANEGVMDGNSAFVLIKLLKKTPLRSACSCL